MRRRLLGPCPECGQRSYIPRTPDGRWRCPECERGHNLAPASPPQAMLPMGVFSAAPPPPRFTDHETLFTDINELLAEATSPIVDRRRTFLEWLSCVDVRAEQIARKMAAAKTADELASQRTTLFRHIEQLVTAMADAEVARLEANIKVQRARLVALELEDKINERLALREVRLQVQRAAETKRLSKLTEVKRSEREQILDDLRENRLARVQADEEKVAEFYAKVREVCEARATLQGRALRLQFLLYQFELDESNLPPEAIRILRAAEAEYDQ